MVDADTWLTVGQLVTGAALAFFTFGLIMATKTLGHHARNQAKATHRLASLEALAAIHRLLSRQTEIIESDRHTPSARNDAASDRDSLHEIEGKLVENIRLVAEDSSPA